MRTLQAALLGQAGIDVLIGIALLAWALMTVSRTSLIAVLVFQLVALGVNAYVMTQLGAWGGPMAGLVVTMLLRVSILACGAVALFKGPLQFDLSAEEEGDIFA